MIDDNIPVPVRTYKGCKGPRTPAGKIGKAMQPGQSHFFTSIQDFHTARSALYEQRGASLRSEKRTESGVHGWRLWRVK
jgi:hypothetical protein